jgi:hypothetical protein
LLAEFELVGEISDGDDERWIEGWKREDQRISVDCERTAEKMYGCVCSSGIELEKLEESSNRWETAKRFDGNAEAETENGEEMLKI